MKEINKETIYDLPIHDSDFLGIHISQNDRGVIDLYLDIIFCKDELKKYPIIQILFLQKAIQLLRLLSVIGLILKHFAIGCKGTLSILSISSMILLS